MKMYKSKKSTGFGMLLLISVIVVIGVCYVLPILANQPYTQKDFIIVTAIVAIFIGLLLWFWLNTKYAIYSDYVKIWWGPFKWKVNIDKILFIRLDQDTYAGASIKPVLSWKGIEIRYGKYKNVYLSPEKEEDFIQSLLQIKGDIVIK